ncbi:Carboxylesterase 3 [Rhizophlyctis rosea]|nr:Carboxylesterase 3 [Rhizophlyctis rosea]
MGFLGQFEDTTKYPRSTLPGNQYIHDLILALEWVKTNIAHFGGDLNHVVISGQSAGAWAVRYLISSPLASGLFHRAISRSDTQMPALTLEASSALAQGFMVKLNCSTLECMRKVDFSTLMAAIPDSTTNAYYPATVDGWALPDQLHRLLASGKFNKVPMIFSKFWP